MNPRVFDTCNCKRSKCLKKYCECFIMGKNCTDKCKCINCKNHSNQLTNNNNSEPIQ